MTPTRLGLSAKVSLTPLHSGKVNKRPRRVCMEQLHPHHVAHIEPISPSEPRALQTAARSLAHTRPYRSSP